MAHVAQSRFYIAKSHAFMREIPESSAKVVSDANHSEEIEILQTQGKWVQIKTLADGYVGWIRGKALTKSEIPFFSQMSQAIGKTNRMQVHLFSEADTERGPIQSLGFGCRFRILDDSHERWIKIQLVTGKEAFVQRGDIAQDAPPLSLSEIVPFSQKFLDIPYAWGGRSSLKGYDCSGFTQMLYKEMGISLPRDSKDQLTCPKFTDVPMDQLQPGDLVFWGKDSSKIRHVGMYVGEGEFIHSTVKGQKPWVQMSRLDHPDWNGASENLPFRAARRLSN